MTFLQFATLYLLGSACWQQLLGNSVMALFLHTLATAACLVALFIYATGGDEE